MKISQKMKIAVATLAVAAGSLVALPVMACTPDDSCNCPDGGTAATECYAALAGKGSGHTDNLMGILQTVLNAIFGVVGFIAVVMLIYGGIQYTISAGDTTKVKKAKDTILYGVVGLIISLLAAAIVNFVLVNVLK